MCRRGEQHAGQSCQDPQSQGERRWAGSGHIRSVLYKELLLCLASGWRAVRVTVPARILQRDTSLPWGQLGWSLQGREGVGCGYW